VKKEYPTIIFCVVVLALAGWVSIKYPHLRKVNQGDLQKIEERLDRIEKALNNR
jgi:hypothetical protein